MKVLILGGTEAIGSYLVNILSENHIDTTVTTRRFHDNISYVTYVCGNAHDNDFLNQLCAQHWDSIIDFMSYKTEEFKKRVDTLLNATSQYVYISSARVYANEEHPIKESSPRLLDVTKDKTFLNTDEYALTKARQENILISHPNKNYTIIRPYISYGDYRLQLGTLEKEEWLYRALHNRTIIFTDEIAKKLTTLTSGYDVAIGIYKLLGKSNAYGETFHITNKRVLKWEDVISIYDNCLYQLTGKRIKIKNVPLNTYFQIRRPELKYQVLYDRLYNRDFITTKEILIQDVEHFIDPSVGLKKCLEHFFQNPRFLSINWQYEAIKDKLTSEFTPLYEIKGIKNKFRYLRYRFL